MVGHTVGSKTPDDKGNLEGLVSELTLYPFEGFANDEGILTFTHQITWTLNLWECITATMTNNLFIMRNFPCFYLFTS